VLKNAIVRFGVKAIMGRDVLSAGEIMRMNIAENIMTAFDMRNRAENWAQWVKDNPELSSMLNEAERLANNG